MVFFRPSAVATSISDVSSSACCQICTGSWQKLRSQLSWRTQFEHRMGWQDEVLDGYTPMQQQAFRRRLLCRHTDPSMTQREHSLQHDPQTRQECEL